MWYSLCRLPGLCSGKGFPSLFGFAFRVFSSTQRVSHFELPWGKFHQHPRVATERGSPTPVQVVPTCQWCLAKWRGPQVVPAQMPCLACPVVSCCKECEVPPWVLALVLENTNRTSRCQGDKQNGDGHGRKTDTTFPSVLRTMRLGAERHLGGWGMSPSFSCLSSFWG